MWYRTRPSSSLSSRPTIQPTIAADKLALTLDCNEAIGRIRWKDRLLSWRLGLGIGIGIGLQAQTQDSVAANGTLHHANGPRPRSPKRPPRSGPISARHLNSACTVNRLAESSSGSCRRLLNWLIGCGYKNPVFIKMKQNKEKIIKIVQIFEMKSANQNLWS